MCESLLRIKELCWTYIGMQKEDQGNKEVHELPEDLDDNMLHEEGLIQIAMAMYDLKHYETIAEDQLQSRVSPCIRPEHCFTTLPDNSHDFHSAICAFAGQECLDASRCLSAKL